MPALPSHLAGRMALSFLLVGLCLFAKYPLYPYPNPPEARVSQQQLLCHKKKPSTKIRVILNSGRFVIWFGVWFNCQQLLNLHNIWLWKKKRIIMIKETLICSRAAKLLSISGVQPGPKLYYKIIYFCISILHRGTFSENTVEVILFCSGCRIVPASSGLSANQPARYKVLHDYIYVAAPLSARLYIVC